MSELVPARHPSREQALARQGRQDTSSVALPSQLTASQQAAMRKAEGQAEVIKNAAFPAAMASAVPIAKGVGAAGYRLFLDGLLRDAGNPTDPVERMLIEQLAMAHHRIGQLHAQAEQAQASEQAKVYLTAAARLTGEFRRLALAIRQYRQPMPRRSFTLIKQQNLTPGGQQIAYLDQTPEGQVPLTCDRGEQGSNRLGYAPQTTFTPESQAGRCRTAEPPQARSTLGCRTRAAASGSPAEQAMAAIDGAEDARR